MYGMGFRELYPTHVFAANINRRQEWRCVRYLRYFAAKEYGLTWYVDSLDSETTLELLHSSIRKKSFPKENDLNGILKGIYVLGIPREFYDWMKENDFDCIKEQLAAYYALLCIHDPEKKRIVLEQIHFTYHPRIEYWISKFPKSWPEAGQAFIELHAPPCFLSPKLRYLQDTTYLSMPISGLHTENVFHVSFRCWGLTEQDEMRLDGLSFDEQSQKYIKETNQDKLHKMFRDDLNRSEGDKDAFDFLMNAMRKESVWKCSVDSESDVSKDAIKENHTGFVYFVSNGSHTKIGWSIKPEVRIKQLQTSSPQALKLIGVIPGDEEMERKVHDLLEKNRKSGEWFAIDADRVNSLIIGLGGLIV